MDVTIENHGFTLLNCPMCGNEAILSGQIPGTGQFRVQCSFCRLNIWADRRDKVVGMWNMRIKPGQNPLRD